MKTEAMCAACSKSRLREGHTVICLIHIKQTLNTEIEVLIMRINAGYYQNVPNRFDQDVFNNIVQDDSRDIWRTKFQSDHASVTLPGHLPDTSRSTSERDHSVAFAKHTKDPPHIRGTP